MPGNTINLGPILTKILACSVLEHPGTVNSGCKSTWEPACGYKFSGETFSTSSTHCQGLKQAIYLAVSTRRVFTLGVPIWIGVCVCVSPIRYPTLGGIWVSSPGPCAYRTMKNKAQVCLIWQMTSRWELVFSDLSTTLSVLLHFWLCVFLTNFLTHQSI